MTATVSKELGFAILSEPSSIYCSKLIGWAIVEAAPPANDVAGSSSLTFSLALAAIFPEGVAGNARLSFSSAAATISGIGRVAQQQPCILLFSTSGAFLNPASFPLILGLSSGGCKQMRLAHAACDDRLASYPELRPERLASAACDDRLASWYKEE